MTVPPRPSGSSDGLLARATGIIASPQTTYAAVAVEPRPAPMLFFLCVIVALATSLPLFTAQGQTMMAAQFDQMAESAGQAIPPEVREQNLLWGPYFAFISPFFLLPASVVVVTAVFWALLNILLGGSATFKQVSGVVSHSFVIYALGAVLSAPMIYFFSRAIGPAGPFNLGALAPSVSPRSFEGALLSSLSLFGLWQAAVVGVGLAVLYRRQALWVSAVVLAAYVAFGAMRATTFLNLQGR